MPVVLCSLEEQFEINRILDAQLSQIDRLGADIEANLAKNNPLRQAVLLKAFSGQLVNQDPNDEPASVLLKRIRAEREQGGNSSKKTKKSRTEEAA